MADRYWVGGTETWNATVGSKWAASSGGAGGETVPTSSDNVFFDANSGAGTVTLNGTTVCNCANINFTGFTGTLSHPTSTTLNVFGSLTFVAGMGYTRGSAAASVIEFEGTGSGYTTTWAGKAVGPVRFFGTTGEWTLQDALTSGGIITISGGALIDFNEQTIVATQITRSGTTTTTFDITNCNITLSATSTAWNISTTDGLTLVTTGSTITLTGSGPEFQGGGLTYHNVSATGAGFFTLQGGSTFTALTKTGGTTGTGIEFTGAPTIGTLTVTGNNNTTNRALIRSTVIGATRTVTVNTAWTVSNVDFQDITGAGTADRDLSAITGLSGDCGGNSGFTFTSPVTNYWVGSAGSFGTVGEWASSSGGSGGTGRVGLPQDSLVFDANSGTGTATQNMQRIGPLNMAASSILTFTKSTAASVFGSLTFHSGISIGSSSAYILEGRGSHTIDLDGVTWVGNVTLNCNGGDYTLLDNFTATSASFTLTSGNMNAGGFNITLSSNFSFSGTSTSVFTNGGTITSTGSSFAHNADASSTLTCVNIVAATTVTFGTGTTTITGDVSGTTLTIANSTCTLNMGSGTYTFSGTGTVLNVTGGPTINAQASTLRFTDTSASAKTFTGGSRTFYNVYFDGDVSSGTITITGSNTFNRLDFEPNNTVIIGSGTTQTITEQVDWTGTSGNPITLSGVAGGGSETISCAAGAVCDYLVLTNLVSAGGDFYAGSHSTDNGGNTNWIFDDPEGGAGTSGVYIGATLIDPTGVYLGSTQINKIYLGTTVILDNT